MSVSGQPISGTREFEFALEALSRRSIEDALHFLRRAELFGYDPDECAAQRWTCWMLSGRFEQAWCECGAIAERGKPDSNRFWDGLPFTGKRVLIRCLHGFGDAIQFVRYARLARREASRVIVQTHPELVPLLRGAAFVDEVITWQDEGSVRWDQQIEVMELPRAFRTTLATVPHNIPYISLPAETIKRGRLSPSPSRRLRIAIQWGSSGWNPARSLSLTDLRPLLQFPECEYYTLQRGAEHELATFGEGHKIIDISTPEIIDAAAALSHMDLLITVDTMLAHLAGALGKPVWLLLHWEADWRWMVDRRDSPWYPTMTLFRQLSPGDWHSVVRTVASELPALVSAAAA